MSKALHYLRIAFSAVCVVVAVLLCMLWVRSYPILYSVGIRAGTSTLAPVLVVGAERGSLQIVKRVNGDVEWYSKHKRSVGYVWLEQRRHNQFAVITSLSVLYRVRELYIYFPCWSAVAVFATLAATPWIQSFYRFSLRTLLVVTTLVAVVLGLVVYAGRR